MLRLVHPAQEGQSTRPPKGRRCSGVLSLTQDERRNLRQALMNLQMRYGSWSCLAEVMGVPVSTLLNARNPRRRKGSPGLALRAAKAAGTTVEHILSGKIAPVGTCPTCGRAAERKAAS